MSTNSGRAWPTGWPDVAELERLANEFFSAPPGVPPGNAGPDGVFPFVGRTPSSKPAGGPAAVQGDRPAAPGSAPLSSPPDPLGGISHDLKGEFPSSGTPSGVSPAPSGLPGEAELQALLASIPSPPAASPAATANSSFYFLEHAGFGRPGLGQAGIQVPGFDSGGIQKDLARRTENVSAPFDVNQVRRDFPILQERVNGRQLVWLDNAATTQKPQSVIDRLKYFYEHENSNIHRAAHELAARATDAYEQSREQVRGFLHASSVKEIVYVRGATEAINLVAQSWGRQNVGKDDEIVITWLEHHANIVPWQQLATETGARLRVVPVDDTGQVLLDAYGKLLGPKTRLVSFTQVSNALGTVTPARQMIEQAHSVGAKVLLDGAQAVSHMRVDVQDLNPDWFVFSGHKVFAPTGIGVLYGKEALLNEMPPWQGGGNMIADVTFERSLYQPAPGRFEAGTGNIADAVGLGAAIDYVSGIGLGRIADYEHQLLLYATRLLQDVPGLRLIGTAPEKAGVLSFVLDGHSTQDVGTALNLEGIAVRAGHHCAQPILRRFGVESTVRPSLALYNTCADIDALIAALIRIAGGRGAN